MIYGRLMLQGGERGLGCRSLLRALMMRPMTLEPLGLLVKTLIKRRGRASTQP
jgi:hypothetical protein